MGFVAADPRADRFEGTPQCRCTLALAIAGINFDPRHAVFFRRGMVVGTHF